MALRSIFTCARVKCLRSQLCILSHAPEFRIVRVISTPYRPYSLPKITSISFRSLTSSGSSNSPPTSNNVEEPPKKPGLIQRFKQMYRDYWYVLVPVHLVTSAFWMGGFYYMVRSGVDIVGTMEWIGVSESVTEKLRDSKAGYFALTYGCYKVATPLRYTVTIGGTTMSIKWLTGLGWIKPVPSTERLKELYQEKKDDFHGAYEEKKLEFMQKTEKIKERHSKVMEDMKRYKNDMRNYKKNEVKK